MENDSYKSRKNSTIEHLYIEKYPDDLTINQVNLILRDNYLI